METATLTKPEEAQVERMAEGFGQPSMEERFKDWARRTISEAKKEEKKNEGKGRPREITLEGRDERERDFIKSVAQKDETASPKEQPSGKDAARRDERSDAKPSEKPAGESNDSPDQPLQGDRHWEALEGRAPFNEKEAQDHWRKVDRRAGVVMQFISQHPQKAQIEQGFRALMAGRQQGVNEPFFRDLAMCLAEIPNPGEVFRHITLKTEDRNFLRSCKNWRELRAAIHTVSKHYAETSRPSSQPSPKPRAPKPPSEVGGRGAATEDAAVSAAKDGNFSAFSTELWRRGKTA